MGNSMNLIIEQSFVTLIIILMAGLVLGELSTRLRIPDVVFYLIGGVILGPEALNIIQLSDSSIINQIILIFGASFLLYCGGREIDIHVLRRLKVSIIILSTLGVLVSMFVLAAGVHFILGIDWMISLLIGAVTASTDPASLIPIFDKIKIKDDVRQTVISESAFNDAMGTIVTLAIMGIMTSGTFSVGSTLLNLTKMIVIGIIVGLVLSYVISLLITESKFGIFRQSAPIISLVIVLITYVVSQVLGGSGYMAAFVAGMVCGNKHKLNLYVPDESHVAQTYFRDTIATIMKMMIFILLGTHVNFDVLSNYFVVTLLTTAMLIFIARPASVFISTAIDFKAGWSLKDKLFMSWVRETGVIPAAMSSLIVSMKLPGYELVSSIVFMVILITLILQGSTTRKVAEKLGVLEATNIKK